MAGWTTQKELLKMEIKQRGEEGCDVTGFAERFAALGDDAAAVEALYDELMALPILPDFPYDEPETLEGIRAARPDVAKLPKPQAPLALERFQGAWLGRACGCALGKPVESGCFMGGQNGVRGWELVKRWFEGADAYPIRGYTPHASRAQQELGIALSPWCTASERETIAFMESDDDIRYTVLGLKLLEEKGMDFTTLDVGNLWLNNLPYNMACTAERQAYLNLGAMPDLLPAGADEKQTEAFLDYVRTYRNPYREWIGAQIRVDAYAYAAAGDPEKAAELAYRDAALSHVKNGVYGAMFCAAMIAAAFVERDAQAIIEAGLAQIPKNCRLTHDVRKAMDIARSAASAEELLDALWEAFEHYDPVHTNNNAALCAAVLLFAGDDYEKAITTAVLGGWDTDCNGATVGSIMGAKLGAAGIPAQWSDPLHDTLYSAIPGFHPIAISECARRSKALSDRYLAN